MSDLAAKGRTPLSGIAGIVHVPGSPLGEVIRVCERIAGSEATVLISGETGTGKEVFARLLHQRSRRAGRPMVAVNCGAIPEALLESELFGHVRGAFTGACSARKGRIALAEGGTLLLDEIGELPLSLQVKLLRVLQERVYEPVGSAESVSADFRLVAATNRDLAAEVAAGRFRRDLYYRLMVCPLKIPPLRERRGDVPALFQHFWSLKGETRPLEQEAMRQLCRYDWPGNVRELENLVERLSVCAEGPVIRVADLPSPLSPPVAPVPEPAPALVAPLRMAPPALAALPDPEPLPANAAAEAPRPPAAEPATLGALPPLPSSEAGRPAIPTPQLDPGQPIDLPALLRRIEDDFIDAALFATAGNRKEAASLLGLQRTTLVEKLRRRNRPTPAV